MPQALIKNSDALSPISGKGAPLIINYLFMLSIRCLLRSNQVTNRARLLSQIHSVQEYESFPRLTRAGARFCPASRI